ncbi:ATP-binding cassette domain-containing protein [Spiroplasma taiwanense]|uniref:ABC transporter ATP-binding protein n=1 Tax=Spiroplasma taiwanense CT-1 TaxID=1276220 RepID=S5LUH9_9MOLU|nr:ATP-binding cassette domain-containing protein [Spiroplasma taiwanense]AGR41449.1 ABC transporter ATP-binding protein [Spiroplasma taiwanense CT-1]
MNKKELIVVLENVSKIFNKKVWAIKKINLKIYKGEGIALIGPNQSGKSVLGRLIASQIKQTGGIIEYYFSNGDALSSIGFQFRQTSWPDGFKVKDIFELYKNIYNMKDKEWLDEILNVFDISSRWEKTLSMCNNSWLQLFSIALAILHKPEFVVLDEVSSTIGIDFKVKVLSFLKKYRDENKATFIIISPDETTFNYLCKRIIVLDNGLIISDDYISEWNENLDFDKYSLQIMQAIAEKEVNINPDPVFKPILRKYESQLEKFRAKFLTFLEKNVQFENEEKIIYIKNINFHVNELHDQLINISTSALNKKNVDDVKNNTKKLIKLIKKTKRQFNKMDNKVEYKKSALTFFKKIAMFLKYLEEELYLNFKSSKFLVNENELTAELTKKEVTELFFLKKKYIQEEIRIMKLENRNFKRQEKIKKQTTN